MSGACVRRGRQVAVIGIAFGLTFLAQAEAVASPRPSVIDVPASSAPAPDVGSVQDPDDVDGSSALIVAFFGFLAATGLAGAAVGVSASRASRRQSYESNRRDERLDEQSRRILAARAEGAEHHEYAAARAELVRYVGALDDYYMLLVRRDEVSEEELREAKDALLRAANNFQLAVSQLPPSAGVDIDVLLDVRRQAAVLPYIPRTERDEAYEAVRRHALSLLPRFA